MSALTNIYLDLGSDYGSIVVVESHIHCSPHGYGFTFRLIFVRSVDRSVVRWLDVFFTAYFLPIQRHKRHEATLGHTRWTQTIACSRNQIAKICFDVPERKKNTQANERGGRRVREKYRVMWLAGTTISIFIGRHGFYEKW